MLTGPSPRRLIVAEMSVSDATMGDMAPHRPDTAFVGREQELTLLLDRLAQARSGRAGAVLVGGDAGVGKSRLVARLTEDAATDGALVLVGHCVDLGAGGVPYLPFAEALGRIVRDGRGRANAPGVETADSSPASAAGLVRRAVEDRPVLARLAGRAQPSPQAIDAAPDRLPLLDAVAGLLADLAGELGPVVLVLEDLHWADSATRDLLRYLLTRLGTERLLVVGTYRTDDLHRRHPLRPLLAELMRLRGVERLDLRPFAQEDVARLVQAVTGAPLTPDVVRRIWHRSEGNAFFTEELLEARSVGGDGVLPATLTDVLLARIERLPAAVQRLARIASVGGRRVPDHLLRAVAAVAMPDDDVDAALSDAVAHLLLVPDDLEGYVFRHALVQEAVYADLLPGERVRLHAGYARLLAAAGSAAGAADLAHHCLQSHDLPGALAASVLAAEDAGCRLAPAEALRHYETALHLLEVVPTVQRPPGLDAVRLGVRAANAASVVGRHNRAVALARQARDLALATGDDDGAATAGWRLAQHLYAVDDLTASRDEARAAAALVRDPPKPTTVWAAAVEVRALSMLGEWEAALGVLRPALEDARRLGVAAAEADLLTSLAVLGAGRDSAERDGWLAQAQDRARAGGDDATALRAAYNLGTLTLDDGDLRAARERFESALELARRTGLTSSLYGAQCWLLLATTLDALGDWDEVFALVGRARDVLPAAAVTTVALVAQGVVCARDPDAGLAGLDALDLAPADAAYTQPLLAALRAEALVWAGRPEVAAQVAVTALQHALAGPGEARAAGIRLAALALWARGQEAASPASPPARRFELAATAPELVQAALTCAAAVSGRRTGLGPEGRAWLARARAEALALRASAGAGGSVADLVAAWSEVLALFGYGARFRLAEARFRLAEALLTAGERTGAGDLARAARAEADALGARPLRDAVDALATRRRLDLGGGPAGPGTVLTPREAQVIALVAQGLTNRQVGERLYISEKTASVHVSNVLAKLGAAKRAEAVAIAHRRGLLDPAGP